LITCLMLRRLLLRRLLLRLHWRWRPHRLLLPLGYA
jgi:hypothetical protein